MNLLKAFVGKRTVGFGALGASALGFAQSRDGKCDAVRNDALFVFVPEEIAQVHAEKATSERIEFSSQIAVEAVSTKANEDEQSVSNDSDSVGSMIESNIGFEYFNDSSYLLEPIIHQGPTVDEIECAVDVVKTMPELKLVLSQLNEVQVADIFNKSMAHVMDADFRYDMAARMEKKREQKKEKIAFQDSGREFVDKENLEKWDQLVNDYQCLICQDVLAAPVLTPCSHSFCFHCVIEKANSCVVIDETSAKPSTAEIVLECSSCRKEFMTKDTRFERHLHSRIMEEVIAFPESLRADWELRRQSYLDHEKNAKEEKERQEAEIAIQREDNLESLPNSQNWRSDYVTYVAILLLAVIMMCRPRGKK